MNSIKISTLRANMKYYFDKISKSKKAIIVTRNNEKEDAVVIISFMEYNSLTETNYLLSTSANSNRLQESINQFKEGDTKIWP